MRTIGHEKNELKQQNIQNHGNITQIIAIIQTKEVLKNEKNLNWAKIMRIMVLWVKKIIGNTSLSKKQIRKISGCAGNEGSGGFVGGP